MNTKTKLRPKQKKFVEAYIENGGNGTQAALSAYDIGTKHGTDDPSNVARAMAAENLAKPAIRDAIQDALPEDLLGQKHRALLDSTRLEHMTFPTGPRDEAHRIELNNAHILDHQQHGKKLKVEDGLSDEEIKTYLEEVNCKVRRIEHGEFARHVYFWASDNKAVKDALDMAYKLRGSYAPDKRVTLNLDAEDVDPRVAELARKMNYGANS